MRIGLNSPQALLSLLIRRRWWIIAPYVALTCMVAVLALSLPKSFVSESLITIPPRDVPANMVVNLISGTVGDRVKSIETTVMSRTNLVQIVREFGSQMPELSNLNMDEKVEKIRSQIQIKYPMNPTRPNQPLPITYFRIAFSNQSASLAQEITRRLTLLFIEKDNDNRESQVDGTKDFLTGELAKVSEELDLAEEKVQQMKSAHIGELPERLDTNQRMLESLSQQARSIEDNIFKNSTQKLNYEALLAETPAQQLAKGFVIPNLNINNNRNVPAGKPPVEDPKIADFRKTKQVYEDMAAKLPAQNNDLLMAKAIYERHRKTLTPEEFEIASNPPVTAVPAVAVSATGEPVAPPMEPNPVYQKLTESYRMIEAEGKSLLNQRADVANRIAQYTRRIENTPQVETELADILRERDSAQRLHDEIKGKLSQVELSASLETQEKGQQFTIVDAANLPVDPATPRKMYIVLGGSAMSLFVSLIFAVLVDIARQRIWTQKEIESFWGVPVLVDIPEILTDSDLAVARKKKWVFAASAAGAAVVYSVCLYGVHLNHEFILRQLNPVISKLIS